MNIEDFSQEERVEQLFRNSLRDYIIVTQPENETLIDEYCAYVKINGGWGVFRTVQGVFEDFEIYVYFGKLEKTKRISHEKT